MARLIFISPYLKGGKNAKWLKNRTHYFATREGVVLPTTAKDADAPPTKKQVEYIRRLTKNLPLCRELLEYGDYKAKPTRASAAEFIAQAYEQFVVPMDQRENYIDYVANRPGAQQQSGCGLWDVNGPVSSLHDKKSYGCLPKPMKKLVDEIADQVARLPTVDQCYGAKENESLRQ